MLSDADWTNSIMIFRLNQEDNIREEPKGMVFTWKLLLLFQHCHLCFSSNPNLSVMQTGTMLTIESNCDSCQGTHTWKSQPYLLGKFPAGNLLLSFAILTAGASISKVLLVLRHMGVLVYHNSAYYYHQKNLLIPMIVSFWKSYQKDFRITGGQGCGACRGRPTW